VRIGAGGEILVEAAWMMRGYWGQPAETASVWSAGGLFRTGEAGELSSGALVLRGPLVAGPAGPGTFVAELEGRVRAACPWAEDVVLVGGGALVAVLTPRPAELVAWANARGVPFTALADLVRRPEVQELAWQGIEPLIRELPPHERVRRVAIVAEPFARENGLRGPTGRVLRGAVSKRYEALVDELRAGPERVFTFH
jgi:long-chain acyl-CoA synthetase